MLHSERPKMYTVWAFLSAIELVVLMTMLSSDSDSFALLSLFSGAFTEIITELASNTQLFNFGNYFFTWKNILFYRVLQLSLICGFVQHNVCQEQVLSNITYARNRFCPT